MDEKIELHQQLREATDDEIAQRTQIHQANIARIKSAMTIRTAAAAPAPAIPLALLAHGDSWFDYPLSGNTYTGSNTDTIIQLQALGNVNPMILNVSQWGDATTAELGLAKQERMISAINEPANWLTNGKPDAILFSGGGDDIAGDQFCIFLDYAGGINGLDPGRFQAVLNMVQSSYKDLFAFRDRYASGVPIFGHCYDFPIPNGVAPICTGPWLKPSLDYCGYSVAQGTAIVRQALTEFKTMLQGLAADAANNFILVNTQGTLQAADWANELHPFPGGFQSIAEKFVIALRTKFPGRI